MPLYRGFDRLQGRLPSELRRVGEPYANQGGIQANPITTEGAGAPLGVFFAVWLLDAACDRINAPYEQRFRPLFSTDVVDEKYVRWRLPMWQRSPSETMLLEIVQQVAKGFCWAV